MFPFDCGTRLDTRKTWIIRVFLIFMTILLYKSEKWQVRKNNSSSLPSVTSERKGLTLMLNKWITFMWTFLKAKLPQIGVFHFKITCDIPSIILQYFKTFHRVLSLPYSHSLTPCNASHVAWRHKKTWLCGWLPNDKTVSKISAWCKKP